MSRLEMLCDCGGTLWLEEDDLGAEIECGRCGSDVSIPETVEGLKERSKEVKEAHHKARYSGNYRIMIVDECGHEQCIHNDVPEKWLEAIEAGVRAQYTEARSVFHEQEENHRYLAEMAFLHGEDF